ncbi:MAG: hypothetical protein MET45_23230 [Nostoc sp. LLA-1]|nr:hypothetical protein [Cyanocohniella sp. LLY]
MGKIFFRVIKIRLETLKSLFLERPRAALNQADGVSLIIKVIKDCCFNNKILLSYFQANIKKHFNMVTFKLAELLENSFAQKSLLKSSESQSVLNLVNQKYIFVTSIKPANNLSVFKVISKIFLVFKNSQLIDEILARSRLYQSGNFIS